MLEHDLLTLKGPDSWLICHRKILFLPNVYPHHNRCTAFTNCAPVPAPGLNSSLDFFSHQDGYSDIPTSLHCLPHTHLPFLAGNFCSFQNDDYDVYTYIHNLSLVSCKISCYQLNLISFLSEESGQSSKKKQLEWQIREIQVSNSAGSQTVLALFHGSFWIHW